MVRKLGRDYAAALGVLGLVVAGWQGAVAVFGIPPFLLPSPVDLAVIFRQHALDVLLPHAMATFEEVLLGLAAGGAVGVSLAAAMSFFPLLKKALYPLLITSQAIPVIAIAPLLVVWFGYGLGSKVIVASLIVFFPITVNTIDGLLATDPDLVALLRALRASDWQIFWVVRMPGALPFVFSGLKVGATLCVIGAVIGEFVGASRGLGFLMVHATSMLRTDLVFAAIVVLGAMGIALFLIVNLGERLVLRHRVRR